MNKSLVIASLVAVFALSACGKKEEAVVVVPPPPAPVVVTTPAPMADAAASVSPGMNSSGTMAADGGASAGAAAGDAVNAAKNAASAASK